MARCRWLRPTWWAPAMKCLDASCSPRALMRFRQNISLHHLSVGFAGTVMGFGASETLMEAQLPVD
jgi:hypothetical protein